MSDYLRTSERTVAWFKEAADRGQLELSPPFQRNPVWTTSQKAYLADTILRGFPVPELYVQEFSDEDGVQRNVVVDGQQRIRAVLGFIAGEYTLGSETPDFEDFYFSDLPPLERTKFFDYRFVVRILPRASDADLREIFRRLNRNVVALNKQELRHATYWGPFITLVEEIADDEYWLQNRIFTANDVRRMIGAEFVSEIIVALLHGVQNKKLRLDDWYQTYEDEFEHAATVKRTFRTVLGELAQSFPELAVTRWTKKSDFYTLFLSMAEHTDRFPLSAGKRKSLRHGLLHFALDVDDALTNDDAEATKDVREYARAVSRAASDLQNRRTREAIVDRLVESVI